jgi:AcrR family transcriptional regulator
MTAVKRSIEAASPQLHERVREAKAATYADLILDVAERAFARDGFDGTFVKNVAAEASVSLATIYGHFPAKMDLYRAVHARRLASLGEALVAVRVDRDDPLAALLASMRVYVTFHMSHPAWLGMHLREGNAWSDDERLRSPEQVRAWKRGLSSMTSAFRRGIDAGVFVDDDPVLLARTTNAMHQVALSRWVDGGMREGAASIVRRMQHRFVRAFCDPERVPALLRDYELGERP